MFYFKSKNGQNMIEFILIIPLLVILLLGIIEFSLFWKTVNNVQSIALEAATKAANQFVSENSFSDDITALNCSTGNCFNYAAKKAIDTVDGRLGSLGLDNITFTVTNPSGYGERPYALYQFESDKTRDIDGETLPVITFTVDYENPYTSGIVTQLTYRYQTLLFGVEFTLPNGTKLTIIPRNIEISSTKIQQYIHY